MPVFVHFHFFSWPNSYPPPDSSRKGLSNQTVGVLLARRDSPIMSFQKPLPGLINGSTWVFSTSSTFGSAPIKRSPSGSYSFYIKAPLVSRIVDSLKSCWSSEAPAGDSLRLPKWGEIRIYTSRHLDSSLEYESRDIPYSSSSLLIQFLT